MGSHYKFSVELGHRVLFCRDEFPAAGEGSAVSPLFLCSTELHDRLNGIACIIPWIHPPSAIRGIHRTIPISLLKTAQIFLVSRLFEVVLLGPFYSDV